VLDKYGIMCGADIAAEAAELLAALDQPKKRQSSNDQRYYPIAKTLSEVCRLDYGSNKGLLFAEAKRLMQAKPTPTLELLRQHYGPGGTWYYESFFGKQGSPPRPAQIRQTWLQYAGGGGKLNVGRLEVSL
jgi:hypothetical protein